MYSSNGLLDVRGSLYAFKGMSWELRSWEWPRWLPRESEAVLDGMNSNGFVDVEIDICGVVFSWIVPLVGVSTVLPDVCVCACACVSVSAPTSLVRIRWASPPLQGPSSLSLSPQFSLSMCSFPLVCAIAVLVLVGIFGPWTHVNDA